MQLLMTIGSVWSTAWPILVAIMVFLFMIFIHELGHFIAAKLMGVRVNEFAIGFGPTLIKWGKKETTYALRLLPLGGFCAMEGEDSESTDDKAYCNKKPWRRLIITAAGAIFNIIFGFIIVMIMLAPMQGFGSNEISQFKEGAISPESGLMVGDKIVNINGRSIFTNLDLGYAFTNVPADGKLEMTVKRDGEKVKLPVTFRIEEEDGINFVANDFIVQGIKNTPLNFITQSLKNTASYVKIIWWSLIDLITGKYGISQVSGPVGVVAAVGEAAKMSLDSLLGMIALITINLGVFNLLPVPALDGGRIFFILIEMIRRKPVPAKYEGVIHAVGLIVLLGFIILVSFKDIFQLITGG